MVEDMENGQLTDIIPEPTPEEIEAARLAEEKRIADEAEAARLEDERKARVAVQTPNLVKLMRQRWGGNDDPAIEAVYAACEPEAYQNARSIFEAQIEEYRRKNRPPAGSFASAAPMPPSSQPKPARKARR